MLCNYNGMCLFLSKMYITVSVSYRSGVRVTSLWPRWYRRSGEEETVITLTMVPPSGWAATRMQHRPPHFSSTPRGRTEDAACRRLQRKGTLRSAGSGRPGLQRALAGAALRWAPNAAQKAVRRVALKKKCWLGEARGRRYHLRWNRGFIDAGTAVPLLRNGGTHDSGTAVPFGHNIQKILKKNIFN